ncbi:MAG TPA: AsmA family protein [Casimicrobiaceae bacterium]|nr:AsmA family protein [Casimicrobiaceae bacterium]
MKLFVRILLGIVALLLVLVIGAAAVVATIDKRSLLAPLEAQLEKATGRELTIGAEPRIDLSLTPTLVLEDVALSNAPWASAKQMVRAKRIEAQVALIPLLSRRLDLQRFTLVEPVVALETNRDGAANWTFGEAAAAPASPGTGAAQAAGGAFALGEVLVERGDVTLRDGRTGTVTPIRIERLYVRARDPGQPLVAQFKGEVAQVPLNLEGTLGPLGALRAGQWPWPVSVKGEVAGRRAEVATKVQAVPDGFEARELDATFGASRIAGFVGWQTRKDGRPLLRFELSAETLQAIDLALAAAAGARPQPAAKADGHLFRATPVSFDALRDADAQGTLAIRTLVLEDGRKLGPVNAKVALDGGRLALDDVVLGAYGGTTRGRLVVDARATPPALAVHLDARQLDLAAVLAATGVQRAIQGAKTDVDVDLEMRGTSPRAWASSATGTATVKVGSGSLPAGSDGLPAELRQVIDALNPLRASSGRTQLACAVVRLPLRGGMARVDRSIAFETDQLGASASGTVDLRNETLDLSFAPRLRAGVPVDLARLAGAVRVRGPLVQPAVAIDPAGAVAAAADVRALLKGNVGALLGGGTGAAAGGNECAVALGAAPKAAPTPANAAPAPQRPPTTPRDVERSLRQLFGR